MELQRTFDGDLVPTSELPYDMVTCEFGEVVRRDETFADCKGKLFADEEDRYDSDCEIVHGDIDDHCHSTEEYTEHDDYGSMYDHCAMESVDVVELKRQVKKFAIKWGELTEEEATAVATKVVKGFDEHYLVAEHHPSEYANNRLQFPIWSCGVGEVEGQIDTSEYDWPSDLDQILADYNGYAYLYRTSKYDEKTKKRVATGYVNHGTISYSANPGGAWHFGLDVDYVKDLINDGEWV